MITVRAPYRISFMGGGTDFPEWYLSNPGAVLSTTINKYCYITARWLPPFFEYKHRISWSQIETVNCIDEIKHQSARECLRFLDFTDGVELHHAGDLPARTGMGTSSSFTVSLLHALYHLKNVPVTKQKLAHDAIHIEQDFCKECVGSQDQTAAAYGGFNRIDFSDKGIEVTPVSPCKLNDYFMLFFTGFQRNASEIEKAKLKNISKMKGGFHALYQLVEAGQKAITSPLEFGRLLSEGWQIKRSMADNTSSDYIDFLYDRALANGAAGGKLLGAGGGGFLLLLVEPDKQENMRRVLNLLQVPFEFETHGSQVMMNGVYEGTYQRSPESVG